MKTILPTLCFFFCTVLCVAQQRFSYEYDNAGNRIARRVIYMSQRSPLNQEEEQKISSSLKTCDVTAFPNPTDGEVTLSITNGEEDATASIWIYDENGKVLKTLEATGNVSVTIDLSSYPSGYYLINFMQGENKSFYKIIKN